MKLTCSNCGKRLTAPDEIAGKRGKCPGCGHVFVVRPPTQRGFPKDPEKGKEERAAPKGKTGNFRPGEKVPKTGTYKCIMCGTGGAVASTLQHMLSLAGRQAGPHCLALRQSPSLRFFREGQTFTPRPNCTALMGDAGAPGLDMTGWDFVSDVDVT